MDRRFKRGYRLCDESAYVAVLARRRRLASEHFILAFRPNSRHSARLGVVVGRRQARRAVERNLVKRICRESFRALRGDLPCVDVVLRLARPVDKPDRRGLRLEIDTLFARLRETAHRSVN